jgi:hypothetical protein
MFMECIIAISCRYRIDLFIPSAGALAAGNRCHAAFADLPGGAAAPGG